MSVQPVQKRELDADAYDAIMSLFTETPEGPDTKTEVLKWNSCIRDLRSKFEYKFRRS